MPDSSGQPSLCQAIARETRQQLIGWSAAAGVFFAGATGYTLWRESARQSASLAQMAAQILFQCGDAPSTDPASAGERPALRTGQRTVPHSGPAWSSFVDASDDVLAAAFISGERPAVDPFPSVEAVWPADTGTRQAARSVAGAAGAGLTSGTMTLRGRDGNQSARYFVFANPRSGGRVAVWVSDRSVLLPWAAPCVVFAALLVLLERRFAASFSAWLKRRVAQPLATLCGPGEPSHDREGVLLPKGPRDPGTVGPTEEGTGPAGTSWGTALRPVYHGCGFGEESSPAPLLNPQSRTANPFSSWLELEGLVQRLAFLQSEVEAASRRHRHFKRRTAEQILAHERTYRRRLRHTLAATLVDPLTALHNRRFLEAELEGVFNAQRAADADLSVAMLDLDEFKRYNDTFGHPAGDALLRFTGDLLRGSIRAGDFAVRYGGDEFLLVMPGVGLEDARKIVARIVALFAQFTSGRPEPCPVSLSAGVASRLSQAPGSGQELIAAADAALYRAKSDGKNHAAV